MYLVRGNRAAGRSVILSDAKNPLVTVRATTRMVWYNVRVYERLDVARTKDGAEIEIGLVTAPDLDLCNSILQLLSHKSPDTKYHLAAALDGKTGELETRFYLGMLDGQPVANITTMESRGVGILGHVFTRPEHRRRGICREVMARQMHEFRSRGGTVLLLSTGFESHPYWIYHSFGFRSFAGGRMRYATEPDFEREWLSPGPGRVVKASWNHWPLVALLATVPGNEILRSAAWQVHRTGWLEGMYCSFMRMRDRDESIRGVVLEKDTGAVIGCATVAPAATWPGVWQVDAFAGPQSGENELNRMLDKLTIPPGRAIAYVDEQASDKMRALERIGFRREAVLKEHLRLESERFDVHIYSR